MKVQAAWCMHATGQVHGWGRESPAARGVGKQVGTQTKNLLDNLLDAKALLYYPIT